MNKIFSKDCFFFFIREQIHNDLYFLYFILTKKLT
jgi:hypothetical protein